MSFQALPPQRRTGSPADAGQKTGAGREETIACKRGHGTDPHGLRPWMTRATGAGLAEMASFCDGVPRDEPAVKQRFRRVQEHADSLHGTCVGTRVESTD